MIILVDEINRSRCRCYFTTRNFFESVFRRVVTFTQGKQKIKIIKILSRLLISPSLSRVISSIESRKHGPNRKMYNRPWFQSRLKLFFFFDSKKGRERKKKRKKRKSAIRNRVERLLFQRCYIRYTYAYTHPVCTYIDTIRHRWPAIVSEGYARNGCYTQANTRLRVAKHRCSDFPRLH